MNRQQINNSDNGGSHAADPSLRFPKSSDNTLVINKVNFTPVVLIADTKVNGDGTGGMDERNEMRKGIKRNSNE